jgi:hypothetical protein
MPLIIVSVNKLKGTKIMSNVAASVSNKRVSNIYVFITYLQNILIGTI